MPPRTLWRYVVKVISTFEKGTQKSSHTFQVYQTILVEYYDTTELSAIEH
jgi:hypothetical protein